MLIVVGLLCSQILGAFVCQLFFDVAFFSSDSVLNIKDSSVINSLKCMQFFNAFGVFIFPSCLFFHFRDLALMDRLNLNQSLSLGRVFFLFILALAMIPAANLLGSLNEGIYLPDFLYFLKEIEAETIVLTEQLMKMDSYKDLFQIIILVGVLAALGEELLFRGLLQNLFHEWWAKKNI
jgi:membrane protease YdiL (CAAX protease family)